MKRVLSAVVVVGSLAACGESQPATAPSDKPKVAATSTETYFPLEEGKLYNYVTNESGDTGMLVATVHRTDPQHGELRLSNTSKRFVFLPEGVAYDVTGTTGAFILKAPLEVGNTWPGEHGGTTKVTKVDAAPKVIAGSYSGCVETVEEGGRPPGSKYVTTYCPGVGMVLLDVSAAGGTAKAELKSYGAPVKIE